MGWRYTARWVWLGVWPLDRNKGEHSYGLEIYCKVGVVVGVASR